MVAKFDGNAKYSHHGDVASIASVQPSTMAWKPQSDVPRSAMPESAARPPLTTHQSNSLPSTPYQHARNFSFHSRSPSPARGSISPRSTHSEATHFPALARKPLGGCKYETAMAYFRRRIPYSLGADILPEEKGPLKEKLDPEEEKKLTADIMDLYDRLLPSAESDDRRRQLIRKLEKLFNDQWPGHNIKANIFGSSGNKLCSSDSDVDICITTDYKELEHVYGMERVVCVSHAKVPIVKIWDPELRLACDMNVNNTLALENTRMIRTYVEVDERVRPLAMAIKHWTKRRNLNDAALGGTLSSYTWICLIISFLQLRDPPILPSLQARPHKKRTTPDGVVCSFDDDLKTLSQFGRKNKQSVGELLFQFFRYYGHEIDYENNVISVRDGTLIDKEAKGWHLQLNNRLCVEEPFNTFRNLGNTADDTSFRGLHLELRRAFKYIANGDLAQCCEQFEFPPEEERTWERPPPQPRPTLTPSVPSRGGRGVNRGGRSNQFSRGGLAGGRRQSNTGNKGNFRLPNTGNASDISLHAQQQAQYLLHDQLYQQIQLLQAQEQELRMQLHNQALITGRPPPMFIRQPFIQFPVPQQQEFPEETSRPRSGTGSGSQATLSPTLRHQTIYNPTYASVGAAGSQAATTSPSSPSASSVLPDTRRNSRRLSTVTGSPRSLRAHSQPARPQGSPLPTYIPLYPMAPPTENWSNQRPTIESSEGGEGSGDENAMRSNSLASNGSLSNSADENRPQDVLGYYITPQQLQAFQQGAMLPPLSTQMGLVSNGYSFIPFQPDYRQGSFSSETARSENTTASKPPAQMAQSAPRPIAPGPLIVDGSVRPSEPRSSYPPDLFDPYSTLSHYTSSEDHNLNTPASFSDSLSQGYQDSGSFDLENSATFTRPSMENPKSDAPGTENQSDANGQSELLASRLQNYHLSNSEKLVQHPAKTSPDRPKNGMAQGTAKETGHSKNSAQTGDKPAASGLNENRHQPNNTKRRTNGDHSDKTNGVNGKSKSKGQGRQDASHNGGPAKNQHPEPSRRSNGQTNGANDSSHGWQTTKKKSRKNTKSTEPRHINGGPELIPADDSLRKGG
ncbi:PAP/25A-associated [Penicillium bovifimosum]|uniref:polynucleotide adenylyltransferase n=1 Tax=Penicillium bovifimosum TaxID=126998 RepID=A0A9W9HFP5_9EURO|nr:PAP/25A-associated [Penicillium bovifimosum]KAJ5146030.1 PAP/25A-associated [Penicillium bovifimosum]